MHMSNTSMQARARLIFDPVELAYDFGKTHPLRPDRLVALIDLLESSGLWQRNKQHTHLPLRAATIEELSLNTLPQCNN